MPSPTRRSSRAAPQATSISSSSSSSRPERNPIQSSSSVQKAATPHSLTSSEDMSEPPRRSTRAHLADSTEITKQGREVDDDDEAIEDDGVTRCICGSQDYPGPPLSEAFDSAEAQSDSTGDMFIQCDGCSVWQHGGCVGIVDESQSPDKYYCELCRPKQHDLHVDANGQRYSLYLPITSKQTQRKLSVSKGSDEKMRRERADTASRASADPTTGKRRGTMRSREHDEEAEQIQRAIEESAREAQGGRRGGKRSREESSDDLKPEIKRQRTASASGPSLGRIGSHEADDSEEDESSNSRVKKARAEAAQSARQAEQREKDKERERARAEAAGRRQERAGRRRGDDDPDENNNTHSGSHSPPAPASSAPNSPSGSFVAPDKPARKGGPGKKVKKLGNNQYTRNRGDGAAAAASSPHNRKRLLTSGGTSSGDEQAPNDVASISGQPSIQETSTGVGKGRWGKKKGLNGMAFRNITSEPMERTIPNMARNLEGMVAFIQRAQLDVAEDRARTGASGSPPDAASPLLGVNDSKSAMELADQLSKGIRDWQDKFRAQDSVAA